MWPSIGFCSGIFMLHGWFDSREFIHKALSTWFTMCWFMRNRGNIFWLKMKHDEWCCQHCNLHCKREYAQVKQHKSMRPNIDKSLVLYPQRASRKVPPQCVSGWKEAQRWWVHVWKRNKMMWKLERMHMEFLVLITMKPGGGSVK